MIAYNVSRLRSASSATRSLKSAEKRHLVVAIPVCPLDRRVRPSDLSKEWDRLSPRFYSDDEARCSR